MKRTIGATLEEVFASLQWERKFESVWPPRGAVKVFREGQAAEAFEFFSSHEEETGEVVRSVYLFSDSLGQVLAVEENRWEDMDQ